MRYSSSVPSICRYLYHRLRRICHQGFQGKQHRLSAETDEESDLEAALCKFERNSALRSAAPEYRQLELSYLAANKKNRFLVQVGDTFRYVETPDVAFFYSEDKLTYLHLFSKTVYVNYSLDQLEECWMRMFSLGFQGSISNIRSIRKVPVWQSLEAYFKPECRSVE